MMASSVVNNSNTESEGVHFLRHRWDATPATASNRSAPVGFHDNASTREALDDYYTRVVTVPADISMITNHRLDQVLPGLLARVQRNTSRVRCLHPVRVGSVADGLNVRGHSDYNIVLPLSVVGPVIPVPSAASPDQYELRLPRLKNIREVSNDRWSGWRDERDCLSPVLANRMFRRFVKRWYDVRRHCGTAVEPGGAAIRAPPRVIVALNEDVGNESITIEIIPGVNIDVKSPGGGGGKRLFIAKDFSLIDQPADLSGQPVVGSKSLWTQVSYESERALFETVNRADGGCRARALKILKSLRHVDETLRHLTTYQMKHALLHLCDEQVDQSRWQRRRVDRCFVELLVKLAEFVSRRKLPHFFMGNLNLLEGVPESTLAKVEIRLKVLSKREKELRRLLRKDEELKLLQAD